MASCPLAQICGSKTDGRQMEQSLPQQQQKKNSLSRGHGYVAMLTQLTANLWTRAQRLASPLCNTTFQNSPINPCWNQCCLILGLGSDKRLKRSVAVSGDLTALLSCLELCYVLISKSLFISQKKDCMSVKNFRGKNFEIGRFS